jgi:hypothetical protein
VLVLLLVLENADVWPPDRWNKLTTGIGIPVRRRSRQFEHEHDDEHDSSNFGISVEERSVLPTEDARILERQKMLQTGEVLFRRLSVDFALVLPFKDSQRGG